MHHDAGDRTVVAMPFARWSVIASTALLLACGPKPTVRDEALDAFYTSSPKAGPVPAAAEPPPSAAQEKKADEPSAEPVRYSDALDQAGGLSGVSLGDPPAKLGPKAKVAFVDRGDGTAARPSPGTYELKESVIFGAHVKGLTYNFTDDKLTNMKASGQDTKACKALRAAFVEHFGAPSKSEKKDIVEVVTWLGHRTKLVFEDRGKTCSVSLSSA